MRVEKRGYGNALRSGCEHAHGRYIIMGDADGSYDFERLDSFYEACKQGSDFMWGIIPRRYRTRCDATQE